VEWWYQQNTFVFADDFAIAASEALTRESQLSSLYPFELTHESLTAPLMTFRGLLSALPGSGYRALQLLLERVGGKR
jgi:hypothetical protein